jgi:ATP-dependent DNA ligase
VRLTAWPTKHRLVVERQPVIEVRVELGTRGTMRDAEAPINEHHTGEGSTIFKHACALGCEGIVSKRLGVEPIIG